MRLSPEVARRAAVARQRLAGPPPRADARGVLEVVRDLGYVQVDPTNVVARSNLLVLWSRLGPFDPTILDRLLWRERRLFEYRALIVPTADLHIHRAAMAAARRPTSRTGQRRLAWLRENRGLERHILARLRREGALPTSAFEDRALRSWRSRGWTSGRNVSLMLETLARLGRIVVAGRAGGERLWTLADGWLPDPPASSDDLAAEATERAMGALGVATAVQLSRPYAFARLARRDVVARLEREGRLAPVTIADERSRLGGRWLARAEDLPLLEELAAGWTPRATLLSPFDNLIIDRARAERLFGFRYRMEIYVPAAKREYGYFVMPILYGDRFIGRIDPRLDRERGRLLINAVHAEPDAPQGARPARAIREAVESLAGFVGARAVDWPRRIPAGWRIARA